MATAPQTPPAPPGLLTAEEFGRREDPGYPEELVRGRIIAMPLRGLLHGSVYAHVGFHVGEYVDSHDLGFVSMGSGVITTRDPDSVRGPDVLFYSRERLPKDAIPAGYPDVPPDLVFEVLSPDDRWPKLLIKVAEYLEAGVRAVAVLDPGRRNLHLYEGDEPVRILGESDELAVPAVLGDFRVVVGRFFD